MRLLEGHSKDVRGVAFLPDGRLISVGSDKTARLWETRSGEGTIIHKGRGPLYAIAVSPDGKVIAVAGRHGTPDNLISLYDLAAGKVVQKVSWTVEDHVYRLGAAGYDRSFEKVPRSIWALSFSADGKTLAAAGRQPGGGNIPNGGGGYVWPTKTWKAGTPLPDNDAYSVKFSPAGQALAVTIKGGVRFYTEPDFKSEPMTFPVQCDWAPAVDFIPGTTDFVVAAGSFVHLRSISGSGKPKKTKTGMRAVTALAPTPDGRALLTGGKPGRVEMYEVTTAGLVFQKAYDFEVGGVLGLAVSPDGLTFAVAGEKGLLICDHDSP